MNVLTIGSQGTQKKAKNKDKRDNLHLVSTKHADHGHVIANDMWQMLLKQYKKCWVFLHIHRKAQGFGSGSVSGSALI